MIEVELLHGDLPDRGILVVPIGAEDDLSDPALALDERSNGLIRRSLRVFGGLKNGQTHDLMLPAGLELDRVILMGVGKEGETTHQDLVELGGTLYSILHSAKISSTTVASFGGIDRIGDPSQASQAVALGARLKSYSFSKYRSKNEENGHKPHQISFHGLAENAEKSFDSTFSLSSAVAFARDLVTEPANILTPAQFAASCEALRTLGIEVEILGPDRLKELELNAILAVGQGSANPPYLVIMNWRGGGDEAPVVLVGKGVCFDSGGLSLKPPASMEDMKWDMGGAGAVAGAMHAIAGRNAKANVVGILALAENMPSGTAQRPGDVIRTVSGKTIEVLNTDAEGRLVLADALWYAQDRFKPKAMIDLATLTGAVLVALGREYAGILSNNDQLSEQVIAAGEEVGEYCWRLPIDKGYGKAIKSEIADMKNTGQGRHAGASAGAVFLREFVNKVPWAHLDVAGSVWSKSDRPLSKKGATGFGVRLLDTLVKRSFEA